MQWEEEAGKKVKFWKDESKTARDGRGSGSGWAGPGSRRAGPGPRRRGWTLTFTGHSVSSQPEARSACAQEAAHSVMAGMVTDSPLQRPPTFVYICRRALLPTAALSGQ